MAGVRNALQGRITQVDMLAPVSTATLGVESGTFDCRAYPHGSRFVAAFSTGAMTEGTLTYSVVDCDTSGGTYAAVATTYGTLPTATTDTDNVTVYQAFEPNPARPFIKLKGVETVSVTTAVPVHQYILVIPPTGV
ncbi:MAG: hypothetical protein M3N43_06425 [Actinomycetota bacterium]|nr:hypothetical protein [Actinomycetota bacterium]